MLSRIARSVLMLGCAATLVVLAWPQAFGLQNSLVIAHAVSLRGLAVVGAVVLALVFLVLAGARPVRRLMAGFLVLTVLFGAANAAIVLSRGLGTDPAAQATPAADSVTVLSWNTLGDAPGA